MIYNALRDYYYSKIRFESFGKWSGPSLTGVSIRCEDCFVFCSPLTKRLHC